MTPACWNNVFYESVFPGLAEKTLLYSVSTSLNSDDGIHVGGSYISSFLSKGTAHSSFNSSWIAIQHNIFQQYAILLCVFHMQDKITLAANCFD